MPGHTGIFQGTVLDNIKAEQSDGKCNRKDTAGAILPTLVDCRAGKIASGKGEMVR